MFPMNSSTHQTFFSFRNGDYAWGSISAVIPLVPCILSFVSNLQRISMKGSFKQALLTLPLGQIYNHFSIWLEMCKYLKETFNIQLKLLQTTDEEARRGIEGQIDLWSPDRWSPDMWSC